MNKGCLTLVRVSHVIEVHVVWRIVVCEVLWHQLVGLLRSLKPVTMLRYTWSTVRTIVMMAVRA